MAANQIQSVGGLLDWLIPQGNIIQQAEQLLFNSVAQHVSDIHIEPYDNQYRIRLRQDGLLYHLTHLEAPLAQGIIARLKVLSHLDVAEKRMPQDGHFSLQCAANIIVDFRLSTCPTVDGEKTVVRILNPETTSKHVEELGLEQTQKQLFFFSIK